MIKSKQKQNLRRNFDKHKPNEQNTAYKHLKIKKIKSSKYKIK